MRGLLPAAILVLFAACGDQTPPSAEGETGEAKGRAAERATADEAIRSANLAAADPAGLNAAEIADALGPGPGCRFAYTEAGPPVLAVRASGAGPARGVIKLHGKLVELRSAAEDYRELLSGTVLGAGEIRIAVAPLDDAEEEMVSGALRRPADMRFEIGDALNAGYRGFYTCNRV